MMEFGRTQQSKLLVHTRMNHGNDEAQIQISLILRGN